MNITIILRNTLAFLLATFVAFFGLRFALSTYDYEYEHNQERVHADSSAQNKNK